MKQDRLSTWLYLIFVVTFLTTAITVTIVRIIGLFNKSMYRAAEFGISDSGAWVKTPSILCIIMLGVIVLMFVLSIFPLPFGIAIKRDITYKVLRLFFGPLLLFVCLAFIAFNVLNFYMLVDTFTNQYHYVEVHKFAIKLFVEQIIIMICSLYFVAIIALNHVRPQVPRNLRIFLGGKLNNQDDATHSNSAPL